MTRWKPLPEFINGFKVIEDLGYIQHSNRKRRYAKFLCKSCSNEFNAILEYVKSPTSKGCGCQKLKDKPIPDIINGFKVISKTDRWNGQRRIIIAECKVCKKEYETTREYIRIAMSCSCSWKTDNVPRRLQRIYGSMKSRCHNPNAQSYHSYGKRGIYVCDEWKNDSHKFYEWSFFNGYNFNLTIDRINNNDGYNPKNCRWITSTQQQHNRRDTKFTYEDIRYIRNNPDHLSQKVLSIKFDCSNGAISRIQNNHRFKDIK